MKQCSVRVWSGSWHRYLCRNNATITRDGKDYCRIHDPEYISKKEKIKEAEYEANSCEKCDFHFDYIWFRYCPKCGLKR
jgi:hypothetical protein